MKRILALGNYDDAIYHSFSGVDAKLKEILTTPVQRQASQAVELARKDIGQSKQDVEQPGQNVEQDFTQDFSQGTELIFTDDVSLLAQLSYGKADNERSSDGESDKIGPRGERSDDVRMHDGGTFDCVISYLDRWKSDLPRENFPEMSKEESDGLISYVEQGGFLLILHNGISIQSREELKNLAGARFLGHPAKEPITFYPEGFLKEQGCSAFTIPEEPYQLELTENDGKNLILIYEYRGKKYPAGWEKTVGKGHVVYLCPGHTAQQFACPEYQQLIRTVVRKYI